MRTPASSDASARSLAADLHDWVTRHLSASLQQAAQLQKIDITLLHLEWQGLGTKAISARTGLSASVAKVAMSHGINANIVHGWPKLARAGHTTGRNDAFVPLAIEPALPPERHIDVELRRGSLSMTMSWPLSRDDGLDARGAAVIRMSFVRIDVMWLAVQPADMRAGADRLLPRVV